MIRLALVLYYLHTNFGDSYFSRAGDIIVGIEIANRLCVLDHVLFRNVLSSAS